MVIDFLALISLVILIYSRLLHQFLTYRNFSKDSLQNPESREDYVILLYYLCLLGSFHTNLDDLREKSEKLKDMCFHVESP